MSSSSSISNIVNSESSFSETSANSSTISENTSTEQRVDEQARNVFTMLCDIFGKVFSFIKNHKILVISSAVVCSLAIIDNIVIGVALGAIIALTAGVVYAYKLYNNKIDETNIFDSGDSTRSVRDSNNISRTKGFPQFDRYFESSSDSYNKSSSCSYSGSYSTSTDSNSSSSVNDSDNSSSFIDEASRDNEDSVEEISSAVNENEFIKIENINLEEDYEFCFDWEQYSELVEVGIKKLGEDRDKAFFGFFYEYCRTVYEFAKKTEKAPNELLSYADYYPVRNAEYKFLDSYLGFSNVNSEPFPQKKFEKQQTEENITNIEYLKSHIKDINIYSNLENYITDQLEKCIDNGIFYKLSRVILNVAGSIVKDLPFEDQYIPSRIEVIEDSIEEDSVEDHEVADID